MDPPLPHCCRCYRPFFIEKDLLTLQKTVKPLIGDIFYKYTCSACAGGVASFERLAMSWMNIIQLVLYHLHKTDRNNVGFFRWKEDICRMIEERWEQLCPLKVRTASWMNSVSSVLSANSGMFESGFEQLKQPGWWALKVVQAPKPSLGPHGGMDGSGSRKKRKVAPASPLTTGEEVEEGVDVGEEGSSATTRSDEPVSVKPDPGDLKPKNLIPSAFRPPSTGPTPTRSPVTVETAQTLLLAKHYVDRVPQMAVLLPSEHIATPTTVKAAQEIKRKLVERLLRVDSRLLQEALASQGATGSLLASASQISQLQQASVAARFAPGTKTFGPISSPGSSALDPYGAMANAKASDVAAANAKSLGFGKNGQSPLASKDVRKLQKIVKPANYVRASPHENELLEKCIKVVDPDSTVLRFKRRLLTRRLKRRLGLCIFDFDAIMYKYLKSSEPLRLTRVGIHLDEETPLVPSLDPSPKTFFDVPFHRDPSLSFMAKLNGVSNTMPEYPPETVSPFSGLRLPRFLHREWEAKPVKMRLLEELRRVNPPYDPDAELKSEEFAGDDSIDFVHVRKEWMSQVNRLLRQFFWPSVDMTESLDYPDYGILVLYRKLVIGCAFMSPDGYVTYFLVHPEWSSHGLGSILLYLLLEKAAPKHMDVTLHVSVTNPALLLYQKFGFKPEEFVVNFYDKYFKEDNYNPAGMQSYSKNAFFVRHRR